MTFSEFHHTVFILCCIFSGSVTSGFRTDARNAKVGGHANSWHRLARGGLGADVVLDSMMPEHKAQFCVASQKVGIKAIDEGDHIHLQPGG